MNAAEKTKAIRNFIKEKYPTSKGWKFSVKKTSYQAFMVSVLQAPINLLQGKTEGLTFKGHLPLNHNKCGIDVLEPLAQFIGSGMNYEHGAFDDYCSADFFPTFQIGKWDVPFKVVAGGSKTQKHFQRIIETKRVQIIEL